MVGEERIHNDVGAWPPVVNVADDVQTGDGQSLNQFGESDDKGIGATDGDDRLDDAQIIFLLVQDPFLLVQQFLDDVGEVRGQRLAHRRA